MFSLRSKQEAGTGGSGYAVVERTGVGREEWDALVRSAPGGGHLLQSYGWGEMKRRAGWRPLRLTLQRGDGRVAGAGQLLLRSTWPVPGYLMYSPKGPWLPWEDEAAVRAFFRGVIDTAARQGVHTLKIEPEVREEQEREKALISELGFRPFRWNVNHKSTVVMDLSPSEDELLARMKRGTRYNVRLAAKKGVEIVEDNSSGAKEVFWRMHRETVERKDFWSRPQSYYNDVWRFMEGEGRAHLFFAEHEGERLAAMLLYTFGHKYIYMLSTMTRRKQNLKPVYLMQWEGMRWAKCQGLTYYDMWGIPTPDKMSEDHPLYGVYTFKEGFGGEVANYVGCLDLPIKSVRAKLWNRVEPVYYRLYQRLKGDVYY